MRYGKHNSTSCSCKRINKKCPNLIHNERAYYLGTLAPDTIGGKQDYKREDKKRVHLRQDIPDTRWLEPELLYLATEDMEAFIAYSVSKIAEELNVVVGHVKLL